MEYYKINTNERLHRMMVNSLQISNMFNNPRLILKINDVSTKKDLYAFDLLVKEMDDSSSNRGKGKLGVLIRPKKIEIHSEFIMNGKFFKEIYESDHNYIVNYCYGSTIKIGAKEPDKWFCGRVLLVKENAPLLDIIGLNNLEWVDIDNNIFSRYIHKEITVNEMLYVMQEMNADSEVNDTNQSKIPNKVKTLFKKYLNK